VKNTKQRVHKSIFRKKVPNFKLMAKYCDEQCFDKFRKYLNRINPIAQMALNNPIVFQSGHSFRVRSEIMNFKQSK